MYGILYYTFDESGVGFIVTLPSSLSSNANIPGFSVYSFTLTTGNGCVVVKSPCVSHLSIEYTLYSMISLLNDFWWFRTIIVYTLVLYTHIGFEASA